jgi:5,5'-dehydrodivanillate O-demethylase
MDGVDLELFMDAMQRAAEHGEPPPLPPIDFDFEEFEHGFAVRPAFPPGLEEARTSPSPRKERGPGGEVTAKTSLWPNGLFSGGARSCRFEWRVPMDDETTLNIAWFFDAAAPGSDAASTPAVHYWYAPVRDEETSEAIMTHQLNRKFAIWLNQAPIVDRTREQLSEGDRGVVMLRNKLFSQIELVRDGGDPKALIYDPAQNQKLRLPDTRSLFAPPIEGAEATSDFPYLAGQPEDAAAAYRKVVESWRLQDPKE